MSRIGLILMFAALVGSSPARAQRASGGDRGVAAAVGWLAFSSELTTGVGGFEFDDPVYGLVYSGNGLYAGLLRGTADDELNGEPARLEVLDFSLLAGGNVISRTVGAGAEVYLPLGLRSSYRRVRRESGDLKFEAFEYTAIGMGAGGGIRWRRGKTRFHLQTTPTIGFATGSFGSSVGRVITLDTDAELSRSSVFGRFGLVIGYGHSWQTWHVGGPEAVGAAVAGKTDFSGAGHLLRLGVTW